MVSVGKLNGHRWITQCLKAHQGGCHEIDCPATAQNCVHIDRRYGIAVKLAEAWKYLLLTLIEEILLSGRMQTFNTEVLQNHLCLRLLHPSHVF